MAITFVMRKNWSHTPSTSGSYGRLAGWLAGSETKYGRISENSLLIKILNCLTKAQYYYSIADAFKLVFLSKACCKACVEM